MRVLSFAFVGLLVACGGASNEANEAKMPDGDHMIAPPSASATTNTDGMEKTTQLRRSAVKRAIGRGVGALLQNVAVDDWPAMQDGKFHGWRIKAINPAWGLELSPGDVVTRVNGLPIEHPEEADAALRSLDNAKTLKIDYERQGKPQTLELPIVDDAPAQLPSKTLGAGAPPAAPSGPR